MIYDLVILGAGAAGMGASIYASRFKINHLIFGAKVGGQFVDAHIIENYPGYTSITGADLTQKFRDHVESYGVKIREEKVGGIKMVGPTQLVSDSVKDLLKGSSLPQTAGPADGSSRPTSSLAFRSLDGTPSAVATRQDIFPTVFELSTEGGEKVETKSIILAMGAQHRALNIPGEQHFLGRGVSYCSTCDAPLFRGKVVAVVGGGNSAVTAAIHLSEFASKVYLIHRGSEFSKVEPVWLEALSKKTNITKIMNAKVVGLSGDKSLTSLRYLKEGEEEKDLPVEGIFIEVGLMPAAGLANQIGVTVDPQGYIVTRGDMATNVSGVFAAGDLVKQSDVPQLRQMITSAAQGAIAASSVYFYLHKKAPGPNWG